LAKKLHFLASLVASVRFQHAFCAAAAVRIVAELITGRRYAFIKIVVTKV
jgi:hypothetical protein